jgi:hypothetical protein
MKCGRGFLVHDRTRREDSGELAQLVARKGVDEGITPIDDAVDVRLVARQVESSTLVLVFPEISSPPELLRAHFAGMDAANRANTTVVVLAQAISERTRGDGRHCILRYYAKAKLLGIVIYAEPNNQEV